MPISICRLQSSGIYYANEEEKQVVLNSKDKSYGVSKSAEKTG
jgi:hypothetical protein